MPKKTTKKATVKPNVLEVENLVVQYPIGEGRYFNALKNISFHVKEGEVVGLVGESGSGKSTTAKAILGLAEHSSGSVKIKDELVPNRPKNIKGRINTWLASKVQMIFQDAKSSLNPREKVYDIIVEGARNQKLYEKLKDQTEINVAKEWMIHNEIEFGDCPYYQFKAQELQYKHAINEANKAYDAKHTKIFTEFDDQRVLVSGAKLRARTQIRSYKTEYFFAKKRKYSLSDIQERLGQEKIDAYLNGAKVPTKERAQVNQILKAKLAIDIAYIKQNAEKDIKAEKSKLATLEKKYRKLKEEYKKELHKNIHQIEKQWKSYKHKNILEFKKKSEEPGTKSNAAKNAFEEFVQHSEAALGKKDFYREVVKKAMNAVSISPEHINRYPGEFSGGQAQRIAIARTIAMDSDLIIADEPISALDVSIQAQVINLLKKLIQEKKLTILFIAHDLQVVRYISNRIIVMYKGEIVEQGNAQEVYSNPVHPYTQSLVNAVPSIDHPERLKQSKAYKSNDFEDFINYQEVKKEWAKVNANHMVFGQPKNTKKWIAAAKKGKK